MKRLIILIFAIFIIAAIACNNEQATELNDNYWVEVTDTLSIEIKCLDGDKLEEKYVINDSNTYKNFLDILWQYFDCLKYELPHIDFNNHTLIGFITKTGPCEIKRSVHKNDAEEKYLYKINITITGLEKILIVNNNWLLIPKIPDNYTFEMDTTMSYKI